MTPLEQTILDGANRCVKCAVCMPHCPTYQETLDENESPRGRIALMQGLVKHDLPLSEKLKGHLDLCLSCMACEAVCPSHVIYSKLIDDTKSLITEQQALPKRLLNKTILNLISNRRVNFVLHTVSYVYQKSGLQGLLRKSGLLKLMRLSNLEATLPPLSAPHVFHAFYPAVGTKKGEVGLLLGCLNPAFDTKTVHDSIFVLTKLGFDVHIPKNQTCCGAMHLHSGFKEKSKDFEKQNKQAFKPGLDAVISMGSGCAATLMGYDTEANPIPQKEICEFIAAHIAQAPLAKNDETVFVHLPCTQKNVLKNKEAAFTLLKHIPEITLKPFSTDTHCCGAAGTYMIRHAEMAQNLFQDLWEKRSDKNIKTIVSNNIGCTLHFLAQLREKDHNIKVLHPVSVLRQTLEQ